LVLASASPRRQALVGLLGVPWRAAPADIDESAYLLDDALVGALSVAAAKAREVQAAADELIVAADTLVVADGQVLGKPADAEQARSMLAQLRARAHQVLTGVALRTASDRQWGGVVSTRVVMRDYADSEVDEYVARGEPFDKAGGYAIQDEVFRPVERLEGCYLNVVGLPLCAVAAGLWALGDAVEVGPERTPPCGFCRAGSPLVSIRSGY
jgi:MAF protein